MEIHIQIKTVQKPEDVITAFAALGQGQSSAARNRPPIQRTRREAMATTEAARRSPSPILSQRELEALQKVHPRGAKYLHSSTEATEDTDRGRDPRQEPSSGVRPKMKPQPFSAFQRPPRLHHGRTLSRQTEQRRHGPRQQNSLLRDLQDSRAPSRPQLVRKRSKPKQSKTAGAIKSIKANRAREHPPGALRGRLRQDPHGDWIQERQDWIQEHGGGAIQGNLPEEYLQHDRDQEQGRQPPDPVHLEQHPDLVHLGQPPDLMHPGQHLDLVHPRQRLDLQHLGKKGQQDQPHHLPRHRQGKQPRICT